MLKEIAPNYPPEMLLEHPQKTPETRWSTPQKKPDMPLKNPKNPPDMFPMHLSKHQRCPEATAEGSLCQPEGPFRLVVRCGEG